MNRINSTADQDSLGQTNPDQFFGRKFQNLATRKVYRVIGFSFDATHDAWMIHYIPAGGELGPFPFSRQQAQFVDGRFEEVPE